MTERTKSKRTFRRWWLGVGLVFAVLLGAYGMYLGDYYRADLDAIEAFMPAHEVTQVTMGDGTIVFEPETTETGFIIYPGGKVEHTAYIPLMQTCASEGILCVLLEMPFRLAVFDVNAAEGIQQQYPEIQRWYIGGHSLGGSMAAAYLKDHTEDFSGLILLGSYSTADLSQTNLDVLSVYGSEDLVMNREKYAKNYANLPESTREIILDGGCHAYFGMYGHQNGDGVPSITNTEQIHLAAAEIAELATRKMDLTFSGGAALCGT